jgi:uncharacterized protein (TIGR00645 family)
MKEPESPSGGGYGAQRVFERVIFSSRWLLAPFYFGLAASLVALLIKFAQETFHLLAHAVSATGNEITIGILSLIDLSLVANLLLMVIFAGYESFVSRLDIASHHERLEWMGQIGFSDLKLKLMASIVAISAIRVLEGFMTAEQTTNRELGWLVGIHLTFVVSAVLLAVMDRLSDRGPH